MKSSIPAIGIDLNSVASAIAINVHGATRVICGDNGERLLVPTLTPGSKESSTEGRGVDGSHIVCQHPNVTTTNHVAGNGNTSAPLPSNEAMGTIIRDLIKRATRNLSKDIEKAVVATPGRLSEAESEIVKVAAKAAGVKDVRLIRRSTATVIGIDRFRKWDPSNPLCNSLIFEVGDDYFDVSVVQTSPKQTTLLASGGRPDFGLRAMDKTLEDYFVDNYERCKKPDEGEGERERERMGQSVAKWSPPTSFPDLRSKAAGVRLSLMRSEVTSVAVDAVYADGRQDCLVMPVVRGRCHYLMKDVMQVISDATDLVIKTAGISKTDITEAVLLQDANLVPMLQPYIHANFANCAAIRNCEIADNLVAYGAATCASGTWPEAGTELFVPEIAQSNLDVATQGYEGMWPPYNRPVRETWGELPVVDETHSLLDLYKAWLRPEEITAIKRQLSEIFRDLSPHKTYTDQQFEDWWLRGPGIEHSLKLSDALALQDMEHRMKRAFKAGGVLLYGKIDPELHALEVTKSMRRSWADQFRYGPGEAPLDYDALLIPEVIEEVPSAFSVFVEPRSLNTYVWSRLIRLHTALQHPLRSTWTRDELRAIDVRICQMQVHCVATGEYAQRERELLSRTRSLEEDKQKIFAQKRATQQYYEREAVEYWAAQAQTALTEAARLKGRREPLLSLPDKIPRSTDVIGSPAGKVEGRNDVLTQFLEKVSPSRAVSDRMKEIKRLTAVTETSRENTDPTIVNELSTKAAASRQDETTTLPPIEPTAPRDADTTLSRPSSAHESTAPRAPSGTECTEHDPLPIAKIAEPRLPPVAEGAVPRCPLVSARVRSQHLSSASSPVSAEHLVPAMADGSVEASTSVQAGRVSEVSNAADRLHDADQSPVVVEPLVAVESVTSVNVCSTVDPSLPEEPSVPVKSFVPVTPPVAVRPSAKFRVSFLDPLPYGHGMRRFNAYFEDIPHRDWVAVLYNIIESILLPRMERPPCVRCPLRPTTAHLRPTHRPWYTRIDRSRLKVVESWREGPGIEPKKSDECWAGWCEFMAVLKDSLTLQIMDSFGYRFLRACLVDNVVVLATLMISRYQPRPTFDQMRTIATVLYTISSYGSLRDPFLHDSEPCRSVYDSLRRTPGMTSARACAMRDDWIEFQPISDELRALAAEARIVADPLYPTD